MSRPIRLTIQQIEQNTHGPIIRHRVIHRPHTIDIKTAILTRVKLAPTIRPILLRILHVVFPVPIRLPDIEQRSLDGVPAQIADRAADEHGLTRAVGGDRVTVLEEMGLVVEGPQDGGLGASRGLARVDDVDEGGDAEDVGEEDHLLAVWVAGFADLVAK